MSIYKLLGVKEVVNLVYFLFLRDTLVVDVRDKSLPQLFYIIDCNVDIHLLLSVLHEIVFWKAVINNLLSNFHIFWFFIQAKCTKVLFDWPVGLAIMLLG